MRRQRRLDVNGILVPASAAEAYRRKTVINAIVPHKDVDAFHPVNVGKIMIGEYDFLPCTPAGIMVLLEESGIEIEGRECVVIGRSNIVGKPQSMLMLHKNATVTICHSRTRDLAAHTRRADHPHRRDRPRKIHYGGYGQAGRSGGRRRHEP